MAFISESGRAPHRAVILPVISPETLCLPKKYPTLKETVK